MATMFVKILKVTTKKLEIEYNFQANRANRGRKWKDKISLNWKKCREDEEKFRKLGNEPLNKMEKYIQVYYHNKYKLTKFTNKRQIFNLDYFKNLLTWCLQIIFKL